MKNIDGTYSLMILNLLMTYEQPLTTSQLCDKVGCERKAVYKSIADLECSGFGIEVSKVGIRKQNSYRYIGLHGF